MVCYHCGVGLQCWESHDSPWESHARASPICSHVLLKKGRGFVKKVTAKNYSMWWSQEVLEELLKLFFTSINDLIICYFLSYQRGKRDKALILKDGSTQTSRFAQPPRYEWIHGSAGNGEQTGSYFLLIPHDHMSVILTSSGSYFLLFSRPQVRDLHRSCCRHRGFAMQTRLPLRVLCCHLEREQDLSLVQKDHGDVDEPLLLSRLFFLARITNKFDDLIFFLLVQEETCF